MLADTHKRIANIVHKAVLSEMGVELNAGRLRQGSVFPDINVFMIHIPHTIEGSIKHVTQMMNDLNRMEWSEKKSFIDEFSFSLGKIIHFLSDYFCSVHQKNCSLNLITHFLYENRIKSYFQSLQKIEASCNMDFGNRRWFLETKLETFIQKIHQEYCRKKQSMQNDIRFSIFVSTVVGLNMVHRMMSASSEMLGKTA